jgi:hypothetical protein
MHRRKFLAASAALSAIPFVPAIAKGGDPQVFAKGEGLATICKPSFCKHKHKHSATIIEWDNRDVKTVAFLATETPVQLGRGFYISARLSVVDLEKDFRKGTIGQFTWLKFAQEYETEIPIGVWVSKEKAFRGEFFDVRCPTGPWRLPPNHHVADTLNEALCVACRNYDYRAISQSLPAAPIVA